LNIAYDFDRHEGAVGVTPPKMLPVAKNWENQTQEKGGGEFSLVGTVLQKIDKHAIEASQKLNYAQNSSIRVLKNFFLLYYRKSCWICFSVEE
jgi:hypothetical protein